MPDNNIIHKDDEVFFRLYSGRRPLEYSDTITRVSYESEVDVMHCGAVWGLGELNGVDALELDDGTIVAIDDIDPDSVFFNRVAERIQEDL